MISIGWSGVTVGLGICSIRRYANEEELNCTDEWNGKAENVYVKPRSENAGQALTSALFDKKRTVTSEIILKVKKRQG